MNEKESIEKYEEDDYDDDDVLDDEKYKSMHPEIDGELDEEWGSVEPEA